MPAFSILKIDPTVEHARVSQAADFLGPVIRFDGIPFGQFEIEGATFEELQIIAAMINAIGERTQAQIAAE